MFAGVLVLSMMVAAVAVDFARYVLAGEKLQTATDAAATAAAMSAKRYVLLEIYRGNQESICCSPTGCSPCCVSCGGDDPVYISGREDTLYEKGGYKRYCCSCGCAGVNIVRRWVEYENNGAEARMAADMFFDINRPGEMDAGAGGDSYISSINVRGEEGDPLYPSVIVKTHGRLKTLMLGFMDRLYPSGGLSALDASRCAQGGSFYYDLDGKWHRAAMEGCD